MSKRTHNRRIMGEDEWLYRCSRCNIYKPSNGFHRDNSKPPFKLAYTCKDCRKKFNHTDYVNPEHREDSLELLSRIGYDITKDISEQFNERIRDKYGYDIT